MSSSVTNEPPRELNGPTTSSPSLFNTLPIELINTITARVSRRYYPILSCVSKHFRTTLLSPEIHKIRSLLNKDSLFISFLDETKTFLLQTRNWFTLRTIKKQNHFVSVSIPFDYISQPNPSIIAIGPEIFFICGSYIPSSRLWIFDTRTHMFRQGPDMLVNRSNKSVGYVNGKVYVIGGDRDYEVLAESFDVKTQTWEQAHDPEGEEEYIPWISSVTVSLDKKVYALIACDDIAIHYDTRDGSCGSLKLVRDRWWRSGACVMDNVLYVYYQRFGLMWYDFEMMLWRVVFGLDVVKKVGCVGMAKYYGKLAFLWEEDGDGASSETKEIWCRIIDLVRCEEGIHGIAEPSRVLGSVPRGYRMHQCLSVSD
ncbi:hypothetical protein AALP_AA6G327200 [Arabis alpina]|uniref:F-box domain-containing protein n=1 Tax=Arabis alpina TaxID=50452 RepID=A0A087GT74_ARAAL|nr:hypothetical protein AALP_AA6G327200 [Arabis alpina]